MSQPSTPQVPTSRPAADLPQDADSQQPLVGPADFSATEGHQTARPADVDLGGQPARTAAPPAEDPLTKRSEWSNWAVLAVLVLCFILIVRSRSRPAPQAFWDARQAPVLEKIELLPLTPGARAVHSADLTGRVVLLSFWSPADPQTPRGVANLAGVGRAFEGTKAFRLLICCCGPSAREDVESLKQQARRILHRSGVGVDLFADPGGITRRAVDRAVGLRAYPTTLVIDRRGRIRGAWLGMPPEAEQQMRRLVAGLLEAE